MSRSISLVTSFHLESTPKEVEQSNVLDLVGNLIVFAPAHLEILIKNKRKLTDPNLSHTLVVTFSQNDLDAFHLFYRHLNEFFLNNTKDVCYHMMKINRLAHIRDVAMKNPFKSSHFLWIDYDKKLSCNIVFNYSICGDYVTHFYSKDSMGKKTIDDTVFCVPQDMAWAYYHWHKLENQKVIVNNKFLPYNVYFEILERKLQSLISLLEIDPNEFLFVEGELVVDDKTYESQKSMVVVINHYEKDTSWVNRLKHKFLVYNKNPHDHDKYELNLPNVGFDTIVYLRYIIDNYDNLPDFMCFLQDDCFFHCMDVIQIVNNFKFDREFVPLSASYYVNRFDVPFAEEYAKSINFDINRPLKMIASCQCIVSKNKVLQRKKEFYESVVATIDKTVKCKENYAIENLWPNILSFNEELEIHPWNCKGYGGNP